MTATPTVSNSVAVADPLFPVRVLRPNADGSINVNSSGSGTSNVAVTSEIPGVGATNLGKAEDAPAASGDTGVFVLGVRNDTNAAATGADGDYSQISVDAAGNQKMVGNIASGSADAGAPVKVGGIYNTTLPTLTNGLRGDLQLDTNGNLRTLLTAPTISATDGATNTITFLTPATSQAPGVRLLGVGGFGFNSSTWDRFRTITGAVAAGTGNAAVEMAGSTFSNITTNTTTLVKTGAGTLHRIVVNNPGTAATITIYDSTTATGTKIGTIAVGVTQTSIAYEAFFSTGLTIVTTGAPDITVVYR
jgi:hypothetical protein